MTFIHAALALLGLCLIVAVLALGAFYAAGTTEPVDLDEQDRRRRQAENDAAEQRQWADFAATMDYYTGRKP